MKRILYTAIIILSTSCIIKAQTGRVGIGESNPGSKGAIKGNLSVGSGYSQTAAQ